MVVDDFDEKLMSLLFHGKIAKLLVQVAAASRQASHVII